MRRLLVIALLLPVPAPGQDSSADDLKLEVKPVICVTDNRNPNCELSFLVAWESRVAGYYCLFDDFTESALRCWMEERTGRTTEDRTIDRGFTFWMTGRNLAVRLVEVDIEVLRLDTDDRRRRRRTRHVWDIN